RFAVRAGAGPAHAARRAPGGRARARRGRGRDDQRAGARGNAPVRAALRPRQRRPVHRARRAAGCPGGDGGHPEPRRRRGHAGRPGAARRPPRPSHQRGARGAPCRLDAVRVAVLAGGLGGSRFALALTEALSHGDLTVVGNVGDDLEVAGLHVSPDLDTIVYTLAGVLDTDRGWGRAQETWNARATAEELGAATWFQLGDRDLGLHLARTEALREGEPLSS